jgi:hypothetical protein
MKLYAEGYSAYGRWLQARMKEFGIVSDVPKTGQEGQPEETARRRQRG